MKTVLFITTSPTVGGNGDTVMQEAMDSAKKAGVVVKRIDIRDKNINECKACNLCLSSALCSQKDDMYEVLEQIQESDSIVASVPIYFNLPNAQSITLLNRLFVTCTPTYKSTKRKKLGIMITCGGSNPEKMKEIVENAICFFPQITDKQIAVFNGCSSEEEHYKKTPEFLEIAKRMGF